LLVSSYFGGRVSHFSYSTFSNIIFNAKKTKLLESKKRDHRSAEAAKKKLLSSAQERNCRTKKAVTELRRKLSNLQQRKARVEGQANDAESLVEEREQSKLALEKERSIRNVLFGKKRSVAASITAYNADLERLVRVVGKLEESKKKCDALKEHADKLQADFTRADAELPDLEKEVADLHSMIDGYEKDISKFTKMAAEAKVSFELAEKAKKELATIPVEKKRSVSEEASKKLNEYKTSVLRLKQLKDGASASKKSIAWYRRIVSRANHLALDRKLEVLRAGVLLLAKTSREEEAIGSEKRVSFPS